MDKKLQDYLHLYLGCECQLFWRDEFDTLEFERIGELITIRPESKKTHGLLFKCKTSHGNFIDYAYPYSDVKPILRPLSDMTEDERMWWWENISKPKEVFYQAEWTTEVNNTAVDGHWVLWTTDVKFGRLGYTIGINNNFTAEQFRKLLEWRVDIFGLIESGLAIDATTLNQGTKAQGSVANEDAQSPKN